jgi:hypothetical protein
VSHSGCKRTSGWQSESLQKTTIVAVDIDVSFSLGDPEKPAPLPTILHHSPVPVQSAMNTSASVHRTVDAKLNVHPPSPADFVEVELGGSKEESSTLIHYNRITSKVMLHSDTRKGRQCINTVSWGITENEDQKSGVDPVFRGAIIVQLPDEMDLMGYSMRNSSCARHRLAKFGSCGNPLFNSLAGTKMDQFVSTHTSTFRQTDCPTSLRTST